MRRLAKRLKRGRSIPLPERNPTTGRPGSFRRRRDQIPSQNKTFLQGRRTSEPQIVPCHRDIPDVSAESALPRLGYFSPALLRCGGYYPEALISNNIDGNQRANT